MNILCISLFGGHFSHELRCVDELDFMRELIQSFVDMHMPLIWYNVVVAIYKCYLWQGCIVLHFP